MPSEFIQKLTEMKDLVHINRMQINRVKRCREKKQPSKSKICVDSNIKENSIIRQSNDQTQRKTVNFSEVLKEICINTSVPTQKFAKISSVFENLNSCENIPEPEFIQMDFEEPSSIRAKLDLSNTVEENFETFSLPNTESLFDNSTINTFDFLMAIYSIKAKHSLSLNCVDDFLKLFKMISPTPNNIPKNYSYIEKSFGNIENDNKRVYYVCTKCQYLHNDVLPLSELTTQNKQCPSCNSNVLDPFITLDYKFQIEQLLAKKNLFKQIVSRNNISNNPQFLNDLYDGKVYQETIKQKPNNTQFISINLNTDGAPVTNSRNFSIWPLLGTIAKFDQQSRENFNNMIIFGLWLSKNKPVYEVFVSK
ncbi:unnamed protein product [Brachionus calyciflorus]|uniref:Uncharacterized protein n=1 Tax=Brachionus calyciflorus TaxID=104777 RepID=A0A814GXQ8_9BILA|nr:unnamed protein product [Brachionus calyciflorus]